MTQSTTKPLGFKELSGSQTLNDGHILSSFFVHPCPLALRLQGLTESLPTPSEIRPLMRQLGLDRVGYFKRKDLERLVTSKTQGVKVSLLCEVTNRTNRNSTT